MSVSAISEKTLVEVVHIANHKGTIMKKQLRLAVTLSLCLLSAGTAMADDAVWGALIGGGAGAAIGNSINHHNGAIVGGALGAATGAAIGSQYNRPRTENYTSAPSYYTRPAPAYYPETHYYAQPQVRIIRPPVYYVERDYYYERPYRHRPHHGHGNHNGWGHDRW